MNNLIDSAALLRKHTSDLHGYMEAPRSSERYANNVRNALKNVEDTEENHETIINAKYTLMLHEKLCEMEEEFKQFKSYAKEELEYEVVY